MALIDVLKFEGKADEIVWKFPTDQIVWGSQLIVNQAQEAVFYKDGTARDVFQPGKYTLKTGNIPLLEKLVNLPFGGNTPMPAEVYFVSKNVFRELPWGTKTPIQTFDPKYNIGVPLRAFGTYGIKVIDSQHFITTCIGTQKLATAEDVANFFKTTIIRKLGDILAELVGKGTIHILQVGMQLNEVTDAGREVIKADLEKYGLELVEFDVGSINYPEDDPTIQKLKTALADKTEINILGEDYNRKRMFDVSQTAAANEGGGAGSMMGAGMGMGMGANMAQMMGGMMGQMNPNQQQSAANDPVAKINQLKNLLSQGLINQEEFDKKKADILAAM